MNYRFHSSTTIYQGACRYALSILLIVLCLDAARSQAINASLSGVCRDPGGLALAEVNLTVKNLDTGMARRTLTDDGGRYYMASLAPGRYVIEVSKSGFQTEVRQGVNLSISHEVRLDFMLQVGNLDERLEVIASASLVEAANSALSEVVDEKKIRDLPLNGRDITQLIQLQPGVNVARTDVGDILSGGGGTRITVAGTRPAGNTFMLDGTIINNLGNRVATGATGQLTGIETIQEFRVLTSAYSAQFSRATGGAFNIITRSGSNTFHGSLFEFLRNDNLDARNFFDLEKPEFRRNQFGFSVGGRLLKNRTFFFVSYEGLRENLGRTIIRTVPDMDARKGLVAGARVAINPLVQPYLKLFPLPTFDPTPADGAALFVGQFNQPAREDFFTVRLDHNFSDADTLMARYTFSDSKRRFITDETFPDFPNQNLNRPQYLTLRASKIISPRATNELQFGFARSNPAEDIAPTDPLTKLSFITGQAIGTISISGFDVFGTDRNVPRRLTQNSYQLGDQFTLHKGRHVVIAGVQFERFQYNVISTSRSRGEFTFSSLADFLRGKARTFEGLLPSANDVARSYRQSLLGWFVQDEFKPSRRLLLNFGLRHEFVTVPSEQHGRLNNLRDPLDKQVSVGKPFITAKDNFAPRLGFAWDLKGDGKTALRGGAGIFFDQFLAHQWWNSIVRLAPFAITARASGVEAEFPQGLAGLSALGRDAVLAVDYDHGQSYVYQYNLNLQHELFAQTVITVAYVGSRGVKLSRESDWNIGAPGNPTRRNPNFTRIRFRTWDANSFYNALQLGLNRRFSGGVQLQGAYTLSKSVDDASSGLGRSEFSNGQQRTSDPFDHKRDRGLSSFDVRQNFVVNFTVEMGQRLAQLSADKVIRKVLGGWQMSGIITVSSGIPFTPIIINDIDGDGTDDNEQRPNLKPGRSNNPVTGRVEQWFDPSAFTSLPSGTRGNLGRNTIIGPGLATFDLALVKKFKAARLSEKLEIQFRAEAFNLLNRANFALPARSNLEIFSTAGSDAKALPNVGRITTTATTSRQLQLALRMSF
ncbi:MAG: TonB-dependent receptor [Acidobacteria bacterium]|nr:TonB-dependent receptor [Acidobacteriota bacterium]